MRRRKATRGFTLLELLLVLGIVVVLASITIVVTLRMQERDQVARAATILQGALAQAKARAAAERTNVGVRLILRLNKNEMQNITDEVDVNNVPGPDGAITLWDLRHPNNFPAKIKHRNTNFGLVDYLDVLAPTTLGGLADFADNDANVWVDDLVLCEAVEFIRDPGDFTDGTVQTGFAWSTGANPAPVPQMDWLFLSRSNPNLDIQDMSNHVAPGDWVELLGLGQVYQITSVMRFNDPNDNPDMGNWNLITLDRAMDNAVSNASYRIIRQPRTIPGEKPLQLPSGAVLDLRATQLSSSGLTFDVVFGPSGNVVGQGAAQDMIFLWVHDARSGIVDNQVLVTVYPKTGAVLVFPVDLAGTDMYSYARLGRAANTP